VTFDLVFRYLRYLGYSVRYVRNITDVGHLEDEIAGAGEDRVAKQARLARLERWRSCRSTHSPTTTPCAVSTLCRRASSPCQRHVIEQIEFVKRILANATPTRQRQRLLRLARYAGDHAYGKLSGKVLEDLLSGTRDTTGLGEKRSPFDFALWKRAEPQHLMRWPSRGRGFSGWHIECSAMSTRYLGETFDIHGRDGHPVPTTSGDRPEHRRLATRACATGCTTT